MKKVLFATSMIAFTAMSLTACTDCDLCTKDSAPEMRLCEDDYGSATEYNLALDLLEADGYNCR
ncbi:MAG: hypothetical protein K9J06_02445 [Flavobacteriales bacterium]|nr:hypothetical protein [Flavobacteriales bacterium]